MQREFQTTGWWCLVFRFEFVGGGGNKGREEGTGKPEELEEWKKSMAISVTKCGFLGPCFGAS